MLDAEDSPWVDPLSRGGEAAQGELDWVSPKLQPLPSPPSPSFPPRGLSTSQSPHRGSAWGSRAAPAPRWRGGDLTAFPISIWAGSSASSPQFSSLSFSLFLMSQPLICHIKPPHYQVSKFCSDNSDRGSCDIIAAARGSGSWQVVISCPAGSRGGGRRSRIMGSRFPSFRKPDLVQRGKLPPVSSSGAGDG